MSSIAACHIIHKFFKILLYVLVYLTIVNNKTVLKKNEMESENSNSMAVLELLGKLHCNICQTLCYGRFC